MHRNFIGDVDISPSRPPNGYQTLTAPGIYLYWPFGHTHVAQVCLSGYCSSVPIEVTGTGPRYKSCSIGPIFRRSRDILYDMDSPGSLSGRTSSPSIPSSGVHFRRSSQIGTFGFPCYRHRLHVSPHFSPGSPLASAHRRCPFSVHHPRPHRGW